MASNPIEANPVTRFLLGAAVIAATFVGGRALAPLGMPAATWLGVALGGTAAFVAVAVAYARYDAAVGSEWADGLRPRSREP